MEKFTKISHIVSYNFQKTRKYLSHRRISNVFVLYVPMSVLSLQCSNFEIFASGLLDLHDTYLK
jgi:hypothetical protein